jgi:hypothetical protein
LRYCEKDISMNFYIMQLFILKIMKKDFQVVGTHPGMRVKSCFLCRLTGLLILEKSDLYIRR